MTDSQDLIREIQEHTSAHGGENTSTHLLVQAALALQRQADELAAIGAGGVTGPLIGQPQAMPDLSALTERGAKAWAGVDAQALRDGGASPSTNAGEPSGHIKEPYTMAEIKAKIASNDYSAEMLLQHAMLLLDSASIAANAGEPVAHLWQHCETGRTRIVMPDMIVDADASWQVVGPLYLGAAPPTAQAEGWRLVPVEPTTDQEWAGKQAALRGSTMAEACKIYKAMLAAAPLPPTSAEGVYHG